jgi:tRNA A-37 threonylcarbamoyl transferase component Bud32
MQGRLLQTGNEDEALRKDWRFVESCITEADDAVRRSAIFVCQITEEDRPVDAYVKIYAYKKHPLQRYLRKGRSRNEARNLLFFRSLNIPTPRVIAWGEKRNCIGRIVQEYVITEALQGTLMLEDFVARHCPEPDNPQYKHVREQIARNLGEWTRRIHQAHFIHEDLKWRNILARLNDDEVELFWIDCPKGRFYKPGAAFERKKLKDCATLDKIARIRCSKSERQIFLRSYLGDRATQRSLKEMCQKI